MKVLKGLIDNSFARADVFVAALFIGLIPMGAFADVVIKAKSDGFPGSTQSGDSRIAVAVHDKSMRILNSARYHAVLIDLSLNQFSECYALDKVYETRSVDSFNVYREKRQKAIKQKIENAKRGSAEDQKKAFTALAREGIRKDGKIVAKTKILDKTREFELRVDGYIRFYKCRQVEIRENSARDPIFRVWVTDQIKLKDNVLGFYKLGTFSPEVVDELGKIEGFPVRIEAKVDNGNFKKRVFFEVNAVENESVPNWAFQVPPEFKKVNSLKEHFEKKKQAKLSQGPEIRCSETGKIIKDLSRDTPSFTDPRTRKKHFFSSKAARIAFIRKLTKKKR